MYQKIMVPLDGSELAECVLPHVEAFVESCKVREVTLVRVLEFETLRPYHGGIPVDPEMLEKREAARKAGAEEYLMQVRDRLGAGNATYHVLVLVGRVAESLVEHAEKNGIDLVLIATHGRSGVTRWVRGSVADKVLRSANVPVLMIRAPGTKGEL